MTVAKLKTKRPSARALITGERDLMKALLKEALDEVLDGEMTELLGAGRSAPTQERTAYRAGYYSRGLIIRIGKLECGGRRPADVPPCMRHRAPYLASPAPGRRSSAESWIRIVAHGA